MKPASVLLLALCLPLPALAAPPPDQRAEPAPSSVAALLQLQRSGELAPAQRQTLPGAVQTKVWQRYVDSFAQPIPESFIGRTFTDKR